MSIDATSFDIVLYSVERKFCTQELEYLSLKISWYIRFEIEQIKISLIFNLFADCRG